MGLLALVICKTSHLLGLNPYPIILPIFEAGPGHLGVAGDHAKYTVVSSANKRNCDWTFSGKSLMYSKNNIGPRTYPWGTP